VTRCYCSLPPNQRSVKYIKAESSAVNVAYYVHCACQVATLSNAVKLPASPTYPTQTAQIQPQHILCTRSYIPLPSFAISLVDFHFPDCHFPGWWPPYDCVAIYQMLAVSSTVHHGCVMHHDNRSDV